MHLHTEQMAQAMREEGGADAGGQQGIRIAVGDASLYEHCSKNAMGFDMQIAVVDTCANAGNNVELCRIHALNKLGEAGVLVRVGARDIRRVTLYLAPGINQE